jgi:hypothetical protein
MFGTIPPLSLPRWAGFAIASAPAHHSKVGKKGIDIFPIAHSTGLFGPLHPLGLVATISGGRIPAYPVRIPFSVLWIPYPPPLSIPADLSGHKCPLYPAQRQYCALATVGSPPNSAQSFRYLWHHSNWIGELPSCTFTRGNTGSPCTVSSSSLGGVRDTGITGSRTLGGYQSFRSPMPLAASRKESSADYNQFG